MERVTLYLPKLEKGHLWEGRDMSILIKNVLLDGKKKDIYIEGSIIKEIGSDLEKEADRTIDGCDKAAIPSLMNSHTHAAMTLLRGYADDMKLEEWLQTKIWPAEAKLTEEDVYWGTKLACLEMIKSGATFFNDMYWHWHGTARAVEEMGLRALINAVFIDFFDRDKAKEQIEENERLFNESTRYSERVIFSLGPHAIYTVSKESLFWCRQFADENGLLVHIHLSETNKEVQDSLSQFGARPVEYLSRIGFLGPNVIAAHCVWLDDFETKILSDHGVKVVHNPISNMKLAVGAVSPYSKLKKAGLSTCLGTDGASSNNNLDMFEAMKIAALLEKFATNDPTALPAGDALNMATINPATAFGLNCGRIEEERLADIALIDLSRPELVPGFNLISDLVYAANGGCVDTLICDGRVLMENGRVEGEKEILDKAKEVAFNLVSS